MALFTTKDISSHESPPLLPNSSQNPLPKLEKTRVLLPRIPYFQGTASQYFLGRYAYSLASFFQRASKSFIWTGPAEIHCDLGFSVTCLATGFQQSRHRHLCTTQKPSIKMLLESQEFWVTTYATKTVRYTSTRKNKSNLSCVLPSPLPWDLMHQQETKV